MALDHFQHRLAIGRVAGERAHLFGDSRRLEIGLAGHQRGNRAGVAAPLVGVIGHPERHQQRAQVCVAESKFAIRAGVPGDLVGRVRGIIDDNVLRRDHYVHRVAECAHVELAAIIDELHQVERGEIAGRIVQMHVLAARIRRVDSSAGRAGVPQVDRRVELHPGVAACVRRLGDHVEHLARGTGLGDLAGLDEVGLPLGVIEDRLHESIGRAHGIVRVLEEHGAVGRAVERGVVARFDQRPRLLFLFDFALDEIDDVGMVGVEHHHLGRAPRLAARLDDAGTRVGGLHERQRSRRGAARRQFLAARAQRRQVHARAGAAFEDHAFVAVPAQDRVHAVIDLEDEACRALRLGLDADVEIHRAVERGLLIEEQVLELGVEGFARFRAGKIALLLAPSGDRIDDPRDELADAGLAPRRSERAAEIFRDHDVGRRLRPSARHLDVFLLEDYAAVFARNDGAAEIPFDFGIWIDAGGGEEPLEHDTVAGRAQSRRAQRWRLVRGRLFLTSNPFPNLSLPRPSPHPPRLSYTRVKPAFNLEVAKRLVGDNMRASPYGLSSPKPLQVV